MAAQRIKKQSCIPAACFFFGSFQVCLGSFDWTKCWFGDVSPKQRIWMNIVNPVNLFLSSPLNLNHTLGHEEIDALREHAIEKRLEPREMTIKYINAKGETRFKGGSQLKQSQAYPKQYLWFKCWKFS